jgi:hypothetical protein
MATILTKAESRYGVPVGTYRGTFLGLFPMGDAGPRLGLDGRPMEPGVEWQFQVFGGEHEGKIASRITAATPTARNSCGRMLDGLVGREVAAGEAVDVDSYKGQVFIVTVVHNQEKTKTHVDHVTRADLAAAAAAPPQASVAAAGAAGRAGGEEEPAVGQA